MNSTVGLRVVVFGATGTAGSEVVRQCLEDSRIGEVRAITRRPTGLQHSKLREVACDNFDNLAGIAEALADVDACFFCLGISQSQAQSEEHYRQITVTYAMNAARLLKERSPRHQFHYLSGQGTDPSGKSWMMWARIKGEAENELAALGLYRLFFFRPGYIHPERTYAKPGIGSTIARALFPVLRTVAPGSAVRAMELARAMIEVAVSDLPNRVFENREIRSFAERNPAAVTRKP